MKPSEWKVTEATVFTCGWQDENTRKGAGLPGGDYLIIFNYEVDGHWFSGEFLNGSPLVEGSHFPLRYDPDNPERNEKTEESRQVRWITVVACVVLIAGFGLYEWLKR